MSKNVKSRWDDIGKRIMERKNKSPDRVADKINAILNREDELSASPIPNTTMNSQSLNTISKEENKKNTYPLVKKHRYLHRMWYYAVLCLVL